MAKEIVRKEPDKKYRGQPCSVTCVGTAYDHIHTWPFTIIKPEGMRYDGYLRLRDMNQFAREYLPIAKRIDFKKNERPRLKEFLQTNETRCCICVLGHYLYADTQTYWSFFDNDDDKVIAVWYLRVPSTENTTRKASQKCLDSGRKIDGTLPIPDKNLAEYVAAAGAGAWVPRHFTIKRRRKSWQPKRIR